MSDRASASSDASTEELRKLGPIDVSAGDRTRLHNVTFDESDLAVFGVEEDEKVDAICRKCARSAVWGESVDPGIGALLWWNGTAHVLGVACDDGKWLDTL